jgi:hypothetical protein
MAVLTLIPEHIFQCYYYASEDIMVLVQKDRTVDGVILVVPRERQSVLWGITGALHIKRLVWLAFMLSGLLF